MSSFYEEEESISEINIIPFVDIILVVLIIFMVTAPTLMKDGFSVKLPQASADSKKIKSEKFNIVVDHTGDIFINKKLTSLDDLVFYIKKVTENTSLDRVTISADKSVSHGRVMEIVTTIKPLGIQNIIFSTN